jgi:hypothetical protein
MTDPIKEAIRVIDSVNQRISDTMKGVYERAAVRRNAILAAGFKFPLTVSTADPDYNAKEVERLYECAESLYMAAYRAGAADMKEKCLDLVERRWRDFEELEAAHYRQTPAPFDPSRYHKDMGVIFMSRDLAHSIRELEDE